MGSAPGPPEKAYSAPSALAEPQEVWGLHHFLKIWVLQFVEICIEIRWGGVGRNSERDRISTKKRLKNASEPSIQAEIAPPPIPNSIFFWRRESPWIPAKLARIWPS